MCVYICSWTSNQSLIPRTEPGNETRGILYTCCCIVCFFFRKKYLCVFSASMLTKILVCPASQLMKLFKNTLASFPGAALGTRLKDTLDCSCVPTQPTDGSQCLDDETSCHYSSCESCLVHGCLWGRTRTGSRSTSCFHPLQFNGECSWICTYGNSCLQYNTQV